MSRLARFSLAPSRQAARLCAALALVPLAALGPVLAPPQVALGQGPSLQIDAPKRAEVGEPIELTLSARDAADVAGYEAVLRFDPAAAELGGLLQRDNDLKKLGRDVVPLGPVELPDGIALGLASCPTDDCVSGSGGQGAGAGAHGTVRLATLRLIPQQAGVLEFALEDALFVDASGTPIPVANGNQMLQVEVGSGGPQHPRPAKGRGHAAKPARQPSGPPDLTGDGRVTHADAMEVALEWTRAREQGAACGSSSPQDLNADGCVDVADLQLVLAQLGTGSAPVGGAGTLLVASGTGGHGVFAAARLAPAAAAAMTFTVNSTSDAADRKPGDGVCTAEGKTCTLRAAITEANLHGGADTIRFNIPGGGVRTITLGSNLPTLNDASGPTTIDGYSQPGAVPNTDAQASRATIMVEIRSAVSAAPTLDGLTITSAGNVVRGLALYNLKRKVWLYGPGASGNVVAGSFVGTNAAGTHIAPAFQAAADGVAIEKGAPGNRVGGTASADRNVISGNGRNGVMTWDQGTNNNLVYNNLVGLAPRGDRGLKNISHGIDINCGSSSNQIGGPAAGQRNVVSGNLTGEGVEVSHCTSTVGNKVVGNYIGTTLDGTGATAYTANGYNGVHVEDDVRDTVVESNVIGNNGRCCTDKAGISINGVSTSGTRVTDNRVGISASGAAIPNVGRGIRIWGNAKQSMIGPSNVVANNPAGIQVEGDDVDFQTITRNSIYANTPGLGIDLAPLGSANANDAGDGDAGANQQLNYPVITAATSLLVSGTACAGCTVEVFVADRGAGQFGQGKTFVGSATVGSDGRFAATVSGVAAGGAVTATATDSQGNTSEFARNVAVS